MLPTALCLASSQDHAERIVAALQAARVPAGDVSVLMLPGDPKAAPVTIKGLSSANGADSAVGKAAGGAATGGVAGAAAGVMTMATVGLTPLLMIAPVVVGAGALVGAVTGGAAAAGLSDYGVPQAREDYYHGKLSAGGMLVAVRTEDEGELDRATAAFRQAGGTDVEVFRLTRKLT